MAQRTYDALFLCTGNSARSILAEAILDRLGKGRIRAHSAGSRPAGQIHRVALSVLRAHGHEVCDLRSKGWEEFERSGAPTLDFVFTVCDNAATEECPVWPGQPVTAHWGIADPAAFEGSESERLRLFRRTYLELERRIELFTKLPLESLDRSSLEGHLADIGRATATTREDH